MIKDIPNHLEGYVRGATRVCVKHVLGTLRVLYLVIDLHQLTMEYDDEDHLAIVEWAEEHVDGFATIITNALDFSTDETNE